LEFNLEKNSFEFPIGIIIINIIYEFLIKKMTDDMSSENGSVSTVRNKIVFVGDVYVGKTSVMCRFIENKFKETYDSTVGVDFFSKPINYKGKTLVLQIWDSAGQERYKSLIPSYVRGASIIFIIYDVSSKRK
jgi:Ras-related protein Rab-6A